MSRLRTAAIVLGGAGAAVAVLRHTRGSGGLETPGGIIMGDAAGYNLLSRVLLGSFYRSVAADVASAARAGGQILDVGCGPGHLANRLARDHGLAVTGLDLDPAMIARARANAEHTVPAERRPTFVVGGVAALPFPDGSFDLVVSTLSMHHWADATAGLAEIGRVLRPAGRALIWDIRPGVVPLHRHQPDPLDKVADSPLHLASAMPWRWPWRLAFTERMELVAADGLAVRPGPSHLDDPRPTADPGSAGAAVPAGSRLIPPVHLPPQPCPWGVPAGWAQVPFARPSWTFKSLASPFVALLPCRR